MLKMYKNPKIKIPNSLKMIIKNQNKMMKKHKKTKKKGKKELK